MRESYDDAFLHHQHHYFLIDAYVTATGNIQGKIATSRKAAAKGKRAALSLRCWTRRLIPGFCHVTWSRAQASCEQSSTKWMGWNRTAFAPSLLFNSDWSILLLSWQNKARQVEAEHEEIGHIEWREKKDG